ncbi:hypothetical protein [Georgenia subflava]|uniref:DUF998 domain-containing protein n=1 Tax=Georgenia subflava TaxID=1622177 RepID=A0A6N7ELT3_9MICO|nr:hypothetical protein [Georgenia subflava]MPV37096.1 hypothetical protein [Georgenia subflava]
MANSQWRSLTAGLLVGNSAPHLASAAAGRRHLTPLTGRGSGPGVNAVWGLANLVGGLTLLRSATHDRALTRWDGRLLWFEVGVAVFAAWMAASEATLHVNTRDVGTRP